jgi:hypothetical protein
MPNIQLRHEMLCDEDTYWHKCVFNEEYDRRLFLEALKFKGHEVKEQKDDGKTITRRVHVDPPVGNLPGPVKKAIGESLSYDEEGVFDHATKRYTFKIKPSAFGDKSKIAGVMYCEKKGDKKISRVVDMTVEVKVFVVGKLIEDKIVEDLKASYAKAADFTNEFVKEKGY